MSDTDAERAYFKWRDSRGVTHPRGYSSFMAGWEARGQHDAARIEELEAALRELLRDASPKEFRSLRAALSTPERAERHAANCGVFDSYGERKMPLTCTCVRAGEPS